MKEDFSVIGEKISLKIKIERIKKDYSQEELATLAGISRNALWKIETQRVSPTIETLVKIANALDIEFSTLTNISKVDL